MADDSAQPPEFDRKALEDEAAADWVVRLNDAGFDPDEPYPDMADRHQACLRWILQSSYHYGAFLRMYAAHCRLAGIDTKRQKDIEALLARAREEIANERWRGNEAMRRTTRASHSHPRHVYRLAASLVAMALLGVAAYFYLRSAPTPNEILVTKVGEVKEFTLVDGSRVTLDTDSRVEVKITPAAREMHVTRGAALFIVFHDPKRPFITCAGGVLLADVGTEFAAATRAHGVDVNVNSGAVEVRGGCGSSDLASHESTTRPQITAGQHATIDVLASGPVISSIETRTPHQMKVSLACYHGALILEDTPLPDALSQINRYLPRPIVLGEPALSNVRYGGTVSISVLEGSFLSTLKRNYSVIPDRKRSTPSEVVLIPAPGHPLGGPY